MGSISAMRATNRAAAVMRSAGYESANTHLVGKTVTIEAVGISVSNDCYAIEEYMVIRLPDGSKTEVTLAIEREYIEDGVLGVGLEDVMEDGDLLRGIEGVIADPKKYNMDERDVEELRDELQMLDNIKAEEERE